MKFNFETAKYDIQVTSKFKSDYKKIKRQGKDINELISVLEVLASGEELALKYKNHKLINDKNYKDCYECHLSPDWLLVYRKHEKNLILLLVGTGSHSELFN